jgi:hypothetical protein
MLVVLVFSLGFNGYMYFENVRIIGEGADRVVVIDPENNAYLATNRRIRKEERGYQYEDHVRDFFQLFYGFDQGNFEKNTEDALKLIGESGKFLYKERLEEDLFRKVVENNWKLEVHIDSIRIDLAIKPPVGVCYGRQKLIRPGGTSERLLWGSFSLYDVSPTHQNPHGALIEDFKIIRNNVIK